jgi:hypothetical protein
VQAWILKRGKKFVVALPLKLLPETIEGMATED